MKKEASAVLVALFGMIASAVTLTWTGGSTGNLSDASWTDGTSQGLTPQANDTLVFQTGGTFVYDLDPGFYLYRLKIEASVTIAADANLTPVYLARGGVIVSDAAGDPRIVKIDAPVRFTTPEADSTSVEVKRAQDVLEFTYDLGGYARWLTVGATSKGTIRWRAGANSRDFTSDFVRIYAGTNEVWGGAFDAADVRFQSASTDGQSSCIRFMGGDYTAQWSVFRDSASEVNPVFVGATTHRFNKLFKTSTTWGMSHVLEREANVVFEKGMQKAGANNQFSFKLQGKNRMTFNGPIQIADDAMELPDGFLNLSTDPGDQCEIVLNAADNYFSQVTKGTDNLSGLVLSGNIVLKTQVEDAFSTNTYPTQLWLQDRASTGAVIDLCGHDQHVGSLLLFDKSGGSSPFPTGGPFWTGGNSGFRSEEPATLYVCQNSTAANSFKNVSWPGRFWGQVNLEKSGANQLTLANVSSTTGTLSVAEGVLKFGETSEWAPLSCWPNCTGVYVKGGELVVDKAGRLPRKIDWHLSAAGKLSISDGVNIVAKQAWFTDAEGHETQAAPGRYTAQNAPDYIQGEGSLTVVGGLMLIFR